ncbi:MAG: tRNA dimethylallyltransferase [Candidatus Poribacteria bacterium]|nr:MAG: tRNA dimethylallyltransferase [Candidatus Poribacteria bacterium]
MLAVLGPTASGKTEVGIRLAQRLGGEIVSVDSRQIYREMDIGTAKPTPEEQAQARHHCIDLVYPDEVFSVADFQRAADAAIAAIRSRGGLPILVGGAGLYFRGLVDGLFEGPSADPELRERLHREAEELGDEALHRRLRQIDPEAAHRIHPRDRIRVVRALEVYELTGKPISELQRQWKEGSPRYRLVAFGLRRPREVLNRRANARIKRMLEMGLLDEVAALREKYPFELPAFQGFGYRELWLYLDGKLSFEKAIELLKRNTHRYAKRQMTWFRADRRIHWIDVGEEEPAESVADRILAAYETTIRQTGE